MNKIDDKIITLYLININTQKQQNFRQISDNI